jgi:hypothetical protein
MNNEQLTCILLADHKIDSSDLLRSIRISSCHLASWLLWDFFENSALYVW